MAMVRGDIGSGIVGCGDGGGVWRLRWLTRASSMISTAVSSTALIVGEEVEGVIVARGEDIVRDEGVGGFCSFHCSFIHPWALLRP